MKPQTFLVEDHQIEQNAIDPDALFVLQKLRENGYTAYIVGGCVRDLLRGKKPKDIDISTSALPEEIKHVFQRRCLLIGRRFRLAHLRFGNKIFEVSTFRSGNQEEDQLVVRDNEWGSPEEDAMRRDFTINGLFYDPLQHAVIDYVGGWDDIRGGILRSIGNPTLRFKQDPVRMIRLLKFHARFGYQLDDACKQALDECREEIGKSAPARLLEEFLRMLESGHGSEFIRLLIDHGFLKLLIPELYAFYQIKGLGDPLRYLKIADMAIEKNPGLTFDRSLLLTCLIYPLVEFEIEERYLKKEAIPNLGEVTHEVYETIKQVMNSSFSHFPKKLATSAAHIMITQFRITPPKKKKHTRTRFITDKEFPHALRFLQIRALENETLREDFLYWEKLAKSVRHPHQESRPKRRSFSGGRGRGPGR